MSYSPITHSGQLAFTKQTMSAMAVTKLPENPHGFRLNLSNNITWPHKVLAVAVEDCINRFGIWRYYNLGVMLMRCAGHTKTGPYLHGDSRHNEADPDDLFKLPNFAILNARNGKDSKPALLMKFKDASAFQETLITHGFPAGVVVGDNKTVFYKADGQVVTCDHATEYLTAIEEMKNLLPLCASKAPALYATEPNMEPLPSIDLPCKVRLRRASALDKRSDTGAAEEALEFLEI